MVSPRKEARKSPQHTASHRAGTNGRRKRAAPKDAQGQNGRHAPDGEAATDRAEEIIDRVAEEVARLTAKLGHQLLGLTYRAREEIEDIWVEANSIRRGK